MAHPKLQVLNLDTARYECVYPTCGGICCQNGRPGVEVAEAARIERHLTRFTPHLRPQAQRVLEKSTFLTNRVKEGCQTLRVIDGWCVFFNDGCVLHRVGAEEGDRFRYKPWRCVAFPLEQRPDGDWFVRQWGHEGEAWDLFCLNPKESPRSAAETLEGELAYLATNEGAGRRPKSPGPKPRKKPQKR